MSKGYVYILTNPVMPGLVKIGRTNGDPEARAAQLQSTGVPAAFVVEHSVLSPDCIELEQNMHAAFEDSRLSGSREFFTCKLSDAKRQLDLEIHAQIQLLVDEYIPRHILVHLDMTLDPKALENLCTEARKVWQPISALAHRVVKDVEDKL